MLSRKKTNAVRIMEKAKVPFELIEYEVDEKELSAEDASAKTHLPEEQTFKTLCVRGDKTGVLLACISGDRELDLKALAVASKNKRVELVRLDEVTKLTGYMRGGCSPIGGKKDYPVFIDRRALDHNFIVINAGERGLLFKLSPKDFITVAAATVADISR